MSTVNVTFAYAPAIPQISRVFPVALPSLGGARTVKLVAASAVNRAARLLCVFGSTTAKARVSEHYVECDAPSELHNGTISLFLQHDVPQVGEPTAHDPRISFYQPQSILRLEPSRGPSFGGTVIDVIGSNFRAELENICLFNNATRITGTFVSTERIQCVTPHGFGYAQVQLLPNGRDAADGTLRFEFEELANYMYIIVALLFVSVTIGGAIAIRVWLYRRRVREQRLQALGGSDERAPLLDGVMEDSYLEQIDADEIQLLERVGKGTFGEVFKGLWRGTVVAVKKLPGHNITPSVLADFLKEVRLMKQLRHPSVLQFLGACLTEHHRDLAIIMEFMPRNSLWTVLHDESIELPWPMRLAMLKDAARGINYLHTRRPPIIHRDLKSHNLLVDEGWKVKVCDFGLSRILETSPSMNTMTAVGTPCWTAPEVLRSQRYTEKADVYSFGIVMWECASRADPYHGMPPFQVVFAVGNNGLRPDVPPDCPRNIAKLMVLCWHEEAQKRPSFDVIVEKLSLFQV